MRRVLKSDLLAAAAGPGWLELDWKCPAKRPPTPPGQENEEEEEEEEADGEQDAFFDFDDET